MDVQTVARFYSQLNKHNLHTLQDIYHQDIVFEDAAHRIEGFISRLTISLTSIKTWIGATSLFMNSIKAKATPS